MGHDAILAISGIVGMFCKFGMMAGLRGRWATLFGALITLFVLLAWGISYEPAFSRQLIYPYLAAYAELSLVALGVFHVTEEGVKLARRLGDAQIDGGTAE